MSSRLLIPRRRFVAGLGGGMAFLMNRGLFAQALKETARMVEGPFYPDHMPLDTDNDLLIINDALTPAVGEVTYLTGRVLGATGSPVRNAYVEIWQCDARGSYIHSKGRNTALDENFQGYGRFITGSSGEYVFRTIKPVPYALHGIARAPHIHVTVSKNGRRIHTTQLLISDHPANMADRQLGRLSPADRATVLVTFQPAAGGLLGELAAQFDVILGRTAEEGDDGKLRGGIGKPEGPGNFWEAVQAITEGRELPPPR